MLDTCSSAFLHKPAIEATKNYYSICVGINYYQDQLLSTLHCAENDAQAMYDLLLARGFPKDHCCLLLGEQATTEAIHNALKTFVLTKPKKNDFILFYFAGHGLPICFPDDELEEDKSEVFLATANGDYQHFRTQRGAWLEYPLRFGNLRSNFFERTTSKKVLFLLDSCHSGDFPGKAYRGEMFSAQRWIEQSFATMSEGRVVLSSCMPQQNAYEDHEKRHGRFTYHLLQALNGQVRDAARRDGRMTVSSLFDHLSKALPQNQRPVESGVKHGSFELWYFPEFDEGTLPAFPHPILEMNQETQKQQRLHALLANHSSFIRDRLSSFVGRQTELTEIRQRIQEKQLTGGYVTITGQAGQGKSSIIAKLVQEDGINTIAYHFIPFNPGPDHQVNLLRNLMAHLILKYDLFELYIASDQRAALRDYFPKVLAEVVAKGGKEIIFIDGLDQLEEDLNGLRDLSFLPDDPPPGIVFVLGTRPDDTLRPLQLLKPLDEYHLPNLSRQDFDLILQHRQVSLERTLADQFYQAMEQNALYLDLVAKELVESDQTSLQDLIARLAHNPSNLFSLSIARLKRQPLEWREVLKPILGLLLAAREPLGLRQIRSILKVEDDRLRDGIQRLGGLLVDTGQQRYTLFHLKLRDYLKQDEQVPRKEYVFATDEEEQWHAVLASWCEQESLERMWEDVKEQGEQQRRVYARKHLIAHLYFAHKWQRLFDILDEGTYGRAKERYDVSSRSYIQDVDFGRKAAAWSGWSQEEGFNYLPQLWRYTLLRCSLRSRADQYPSELFQLLLLLGREQEALGHAELLTDPVRKAAILQDIAEHLSKQPGRQTESEQLSLRAYEVACSITWSYDQAKALKELALSLTQAQRWEQAEYLWKQAGEVARSITEDYSQAWALRELVRSLVQAQRWEQAEEVARFITENYQQAEVLTELASFLAQARCWEQAERLWKQAEEVARSITESNLQAAWALRKLAVSLTQAQRWEQAEEVARSITESYDQAEALSTLACSLAQAQRWEQAEHFWKQAEEVARSITENCQQAEALRELAVSLTQAQRWEQAEHFWKQAEEVARSVTESDLQAWALRKLAVSLTQAQRWEQAEEVAHSITESHQQAEALRELAVSLTQAQRWEQAEHLWKQAEEVARSITESDQQARALRELALSLNAQISFLVQAQRWEQAEEVARSITESDQQTRALRELAVSLAQAQRWEQAEEVIRSIIESYDQAVALSTLAVSLAQAQRWEQAECLWKQAEEVARSITESDQQARALSALGITLVEKQQWEYAESICAKAEEVARSITESYDQAVALSTLASFLAQAQHWEQAEEVARSITQSNQQARALSVLTSSLAQAQRWEQAEAVACSIDQQARVLSVLTSSLAQAQRWEQAEEVARSITESYDQAEALSTLACSLAQAQHWEQAECLWKEAEEVARSITESDQQAWALSTLASSLAQAQRWKQAEEVARSITESNQQAWALSILASSLAQVQRWKQAEEVVLSITESDHNQQAWALRALASSLTEAQCWKEAEEVARSITESYNQAVALSTLACSLAQAQHWEQAECLWKEAEEVAHSAHSITQSYERARALKELVSSLAQAQRWEQAEEVAHSITESYDQAVALSTLACSLAQAQHWEQAECLWKEAEEVAHSAHSITQSDQQASALSTLVEVLLKHGDYEKVFSLVQRSWLQAETRAFALRLFSSAIGLTCLKPEMGIAFYQAFKWVDSFLGGGHIELRKDEELRFE